MKRAIFLSMFFSNRRMNTQKVFTVDPRKEQLSNCRLFCIHVAYLFTKTISTDTFATKNTISEFPTIKNQNVFSLQATVNFASQLRNGGIQLLFLKRWPMMRSKKPFGK